MAITYLDQPSSKITYLDEPPKQGVLGAVGEALASRPELRPYDTPSVPQNTGNPVRDALTAARETLTAPIRTGQTIAQGPDVLGEAVSNEVNRAGYPKTGAGVGTAISVLGPMAMGGPTGEVSLFKPTVPLARRGAVSAAEEFGIPLTRAEQTGARFTEGLESGLEKTPFGTIPINKFRESQIAAKQAALQKFKGEMGTPSDMFEVGQRAKEGYGYEMGQARNIKNELYDRVPQDVRVPLKNSIDTADTIIQEQSRYLPTTRNGDVISVAKDIQSASLPPIRNTVETTPKVIGKTGESAYRLDQQIPESAIQPNYPQIARLRSVLNDKIKANTIVSADGTSTMTQAGRDFMRLKTSLDKDIEGYASSPASPLESMTAKEFKRSYGEATANAKLFTETYQNPEMKRLAMTDPEKIVNSIFKKNSETDINRFRKAVGEGPFQLSKRRFTQDLLESKNIKNELSKYEPGTLRAIYDKGELTKLTKLGEAFDLIQYAEKTAGNPSGTGRMVTGAGSFGAAGYALKAGRPDVAAAILGIPYAVAKEYINTSGGAKISSFTQRAARGTAISGTRRK